MAIPSILSNQIAIDPIDGIFYFRNSNGAIVGSSLSILQASNTQITTEDSLQVSGNLVVDGNLIVNGAIVTINTESIVVEDKNIELGSGITTNANASGGGITLKGATDKTFNWINSTGSWTSSEDIDLLSGKVYKINGVEVLSANAYAGSAAKWTNSRKITLAGDLTGNVSIDGSADVTLTATVATNSISLGTDTTGDYISSLVAGLGISLSNNSGETSTPTVALSASIDHLTDVTLSSPANGDFFRYNGSVWVNDAINLSTDTIGDYVDHLSAGTGITITNNSGEASVPTISIPQSVAPNANVSFNQVTSSIVGNVTGNVTGNIAGNVTGNVVGDVTGNVVGNTAGTHTGSVIGTASNALVWTNQRKITLDGDVTGNVFIDGSANVTITTTIASNSVELGADTTGQYVANLVSGTGITITDNSGEGMTPVIKVADSYTTNMVSNIANSAASVSTYADGVGNTAYSNAVTHTNTGLSLKANIASPTFTGTVTTPILVVDSIEVDTTGATTGQVLKFNGTKFAPGSDNTADAGSLSITDLADVAISGNATGQFLKFNGNTWVNSSISTINNLYDVGDVTITSASSGQFLKWNGLAWVNDTIDLATDTTGGYVTSLVAGTGITLANNSGEGTTPTVTVDTSVIQARVTNVTDTEIGYLDGVASAIQTQLNDKSPIASPTFTGVPVAPTAAVNTNTTQIATTAFVINEIADNAYIPVIDNLDDLGDVTLTTSPGPASGDLLKWNGTAWVNDSALLAAKAPLASPVLTGTPTAPTAAAATNTTQVATTAFVRAEVAALVNSAGATLDTLGEIATALGNDASLSTTLTNSIALKAPLVSPTFTGTVTLPSGSAITLPTVSSGINHSGSTSGTTKLQASAVASGTLTLPAVTGTLVSTGDTGTITRTMIENDTIINANIKTTAAIELGKIADATIDTKTTDYSLVLTDKNKFIKMNVVSSANTVTVPTNASVEFPIGSQIHIIQYGSGKTQVIPVSGTVTLYATPGAYLRAQFSSATLLKCDTNIWMLMGDLSAS